MCKSGCKIACTNRQYKINIIKDRVCKSCIFERCNMWTLTAGILRPTILIVNLKTKDKDASNMCWERRLLFVRMCLWLSSRIFCPKHLWLYTTVYLTLYLNTSTSLQSTRQPNNQLISLGYLYHRNLGTVLDYTVWEKALQNNIFDRTRERHQMVQLVRKIFRF